MKMHPVPRLVALPEGQTLPVHRKKSFGSFSSDTWPKAAW